MFNKFKAFITKDVENENEVKTYAISLRLNLLVLCVYMFVSFAMDIMMERWGSGIFDGISTVLCVWMFYRTYHNSTRLISFMINAFILIMMVVHTLTMGNNISVLNFMYVQIVLLYVLDYMETKWKLIYILGMVLVRAFVYDYVRKFGTIYTISHGEVQFWQGVHMVVISLLLIFAISVATQDFRIMQRKLVSYNKKLQNIANIDPLTGLKNRRCITEYINEKSREYQNGESNALTIAIGDIDFFKRINDTYGHNCGDVVLKELSDVFKKFMEGKGSAARWGGEEFLFVFNNINGDEASYMLSELRKTIKSMEFTFEEDLVKISVTFGVAEYDLRKGTDSTIGEADEKLYIGKEKGRDIIIY